MPSNTRLQPHKVNLSPVYRCCMGKHAAHMGPQSAVLQGTVRTAGPFILSVSKYSKISSNYTLEGLSRKTASLKFFIIITMV